MFCSATHSCAWSPAWLAASARQRPPPPTLVGSSRPASRCTIVRCTEAAARPPLRLAWWLLRQRTEAGCSVTTWTAAVARTPQASFAKGVAPMEVVPPVAQHWGHESGHRRWASQKVALRRPCCAGVQATSQAIASWMQEVCSPRVSVARRSLPTAVPMTVAQHLPSFFSGTSGASLKQRGDDGVICVWTTRRGQGWAGARREWREARQRGRWTRTSSGQLHRASACSFEHHCSRPPWPRVLQKRRKTRWRQLYRGGHQS